MTREQFIDLQTRGLDELFSLTHSEDEARKRFAQLSLDTYDFLTSQSVEVLWGFRLSGESSENLFGRKRGAKVPESLDRRWRDWNAEYFALKVRNPCLELRDMMRDISESHSASSWPSGRERHIQAWVDAGDPAAPPPFDDRYGIVTPEFFQRLREVRQRCGGWLYSNDKLGGVVFAPEPEWQKVRAEQEAAEVKRRGDWEESRARLDRMAKRLAEVMTIAREDEKFWNALKTWELAREAKRPPEPPKEELPEAGVLAGPLRLVQASPEQQKKHDNPPVDSIFAEFIARVRHSHDALTVHDFVLNLRSAVRRELGLDHVIVWRGGPGIAEAQ
jgi:hypothetical protein